MQGLFSFVAIATVLGAALLLPSVAASACNGELHYWIEEGKLLDGKLQDPPVAPGFHGPVANLTMPYADNTAAERVQVAAYVDDGTCPGGVRFEEVVGPVHHTPSAPRIIPYVGPFALNADGTFEYTNRLGTTNIVWNGYDYFTFNVICIATNATLCSNSVARINVVFWYAESQNEFLAESAFGYNFTDYKNCDSSKSCTPWKTQHTLPKFWDVQGAGEAASLLPRAPTTVEMYDGVVRDSDEITVEFDHNTVIFKAYSRIGNLAQRFPTYELIKWRDGEFFTQADVLSYVKPKSTAFDVSCLDNQGAVFTGDKADPLVWDTSANGGQGGRGTLADGGGVNYYQKFNAPTCATMGSACNLSPLYSPRNVQDNSTETVWKVEVNGCDVIWTGMATWNAMRAQERTGAPGNKVWLMTMDTAGTSHKLYTEIYSQIVQPNSWTQPSRGFATIDRKYEITITLAQDTDFHFHLGIDAFTVDLEWFRYQMDNSSGFGDDEAFGYNMIIYPLRIEDLQESAPQRRVVGFKYRRHSWTAPDATQCDSCNTGTTTCEHDFHGLPQGDYQSAEFPASPACLGPPYPVVFLTKGPTTVAGDCPGLVAGNHPLIILDEPGLSPPKGTDLYGNPTVCGTDYQNVTIRGWAPNSASRNKLAYFGFEGTILIEFLLENGEHPTTVINPSIYMKSLTVDATFAATAQHCLSSPYWPVPDPLNDDLPDQNGGYLCLTPMTDGWSVGPTDWVVITFDVEQMDPELVDVEWLKMTIDDIPQPIYFVYRAANMTDLSASLPPGLGRFWTDDSNGPPYTFFNFRNLKDIPGDKLISLYQNRPPGADASLWPKDQDWGMAFTPGAWNTNAHLTITAKLRILTGGTRTARRRFASLQAPRDGAVTTNVKLNLNPYITPEMRQSQLERNGAVPRRDTTSDNRSTASDSQGMSKSMEMMLIVVGAVCGFLFVVASVGVAMFVRARVRYSGVARTSSAMTLSVAPSTNAQPPPAA